MIEAVYTITEAEFLEAQKLWCPQVARKIPGYWVMQTTAALFGICFGLSLRYLPAPLLVGSIASFCLVLAVGQWRKRAARKYQYQQKNLSHEETSVRFDDEGYRDHKANACGGWINWDGFSAWRETPRIFVLGRGVMFITVPKRPFTAEQQDQLRALFLQRIQEKA